MSKCPFEKMQPLGFKNSQNTEKRAVSGIYVRPLKLFALSYIICLNDVIIFT